MCDMIPFSEHWRMSLAQAQHLQHALMGYLPGFATPRIVCDVPFVGKRWVHQVHTYDTERGISYWTKNYRTSIESEDAEALSREYVYYDPIYTLPADGPGLVARARRQRRRAARGARGQPGRARPARRGRQPRRPRLTLACHPVPRAHPDTRGVRAPQRTGSADERGQTVGRPS